MNHTRAFSLELRTAAEITPAMVVRAADHIDTLMDVIEMQRGPVALPALPTPASALRTLRDWHDSCAKSSATQDATPSKYRFHRAAVEALNVYFPKDDQL
jgi:hypothetical protein